MSHSFSYLSSLPLVTDPIAVASNDCAKDCYTQAFGRNTLSKPHIRLLGINHRWISNKSAPLHYPPLYLSFPKSVLFPSHLQHPSICPCSPCLTLCPYVPCFIELHFHVTMILSFLTYSFPHPVPVFPCFMLVPFVPSPWPSQANPAA